MIFVVGNLLFIDYSFSVINRCVPSFLFDFLDKGGDLMEKVKNESLVNVTDSGSNELTDEIIKEGLK